MRMSKIHATTCFLLSICLSLAASAADTRPNILFIPVDDLKPMLACYGETDIQTPNIDRIAERGTVFLNNSCQQAVCGPTRASLMTGLYPDTTQVWDLKTRMRDVTPDILTLPQYLRQNGYETAGVGKTFDYRCCDNQADEPSWSLPYDKYATTCINPSYGKPDQGYYQSEVVREANRRATKELKQKLGINSISKRPELKDYPMCHPSVEACDVPDDAYIDGAIAKRGCQYLEQLAQGGEPFFLSVGFKRPHLPFAAPTRYWDLYDRDDISLAEFRDKANGAPEFAYHDSGELRNAYSDIPLSGPIPDEKQIEMIHGYMACVSYIDAQVGHLLDKLVELGIEDNTVICLWGDHGFHLGDHGMFCKHSNLENAVRAPLLFAAPDQKAKGTRTESPSEFVDIFPTLCELVGLPVPEVLQGRSLVKILDDPTVSVRHAALGQYPRSVSRKSAMGYTLRSPDFRYVKWLAMDFRKGERSGELAAVELYDMRRDPHESINLAGKPEYASIVEAFEAEFTRRGIAQVID